MVAGASIFGRAAATPGLGAYWPVGLRQEVGVATQAIAGAFDLHDNGVMKEAVQYRLRDDRVWVDFSPFGNAAVIVSQVVVWRGPIPAYSGVSLSQSCAGHCREHDDGIVAERRHGFKRHVAGVDVLEEEIGATRHEGLVISEQEAAVARMSSGQA